MKTNIINGQTLGGSADIFARSSKMNNSINTISRKERRRIKREMNKLWDVSLNNPKYGICCICGKPYNNHGNNARPLMDGRCCDECDSKYVIPYRIAHHDEYTAQFKRSEAEIQNNLAMFNSSVVEG